MIFNKFHYASLQIQLLVIRALRAVIVPYQSVILGLDIAFQLEKVRHALAFVEVYFVVIMK